MDKKLIKLYATVIISISLIITIVLYAVDFKGIITEIGSEIKQQIEEIQDKDDDVKEKIEEDVKSKVEEVKEKADKVKDDIEEKKYKLKEKLKEFKL